MNNNGTIMEVETAKEKKMSFWDKLFGCLLPEEPDPVTFNVDVSKEDFGTFILEVLEPASRKSTGQTQGHSGLNKIIDGLYNPLIISNDFEKEYRALLRIESETYRDLNLKINRNDGNIYKVTFTVRNRENILRAVNRAIDKFNGLVAKP